ncbi:MFS transporter [Iningainema tapete]|uniref:MFS transporter n=1 Tax=Iningainema tapete BLCC-T55 TaxID=2748662 RepID=A0A8J6Y3C6_9CYAN|nr:MFS transporter [Iningainema tapete]MBD2778888.1 MFS transporter [Iningainema tapete BLCC-T55]
MVNSEHKHLRYNFTVNIADGAFFGLGYGFASSITIVPLFVSTLTNSAILIALIPAIQRLGWQLPQLLTADQVARLQRYKPTTMLMTIHQKLPFFGLALVAWLLPLLGSQTGLWLTYILLIWQGLGGGFSATAWQSMVAKIIPPSKLGLFYGSQSAAANLMGSCSALMAGLLLQRIPPPLNFALCFLCASVAMALSWFCMSKTREPKSDPSATIGTRREFWRNISAIIQYDRNFRKFIVARLGSQFALMAPTFYTVYAVREYGMGEESTGLITGLLMVTQTITGLLMGWIGDRSGYKCILQVGGLASAASALLATLAPTLSWFYLAFVGAGIAMVSLQNIAMVMTAEFGSDRDRPAYIGLCNTLIAPATILAPLIGGWIADKIGYEATFIVTAVSGLATALLLMGVRNPRHQKLCRDAPAGRLYQ